MDLGVERVESYPRFVHTIWSVLLAHQNAAARVSIRVPRMDADAGKVRHVHDVRHLPLEAVAEVDDHVVGSRVDGRLVSHFLSRPTELVLQRVTLEGAVNRQSSDRRLVGGLEPGEEQIHGITLPSFHAGSLGPITYANGVRRRLW